MGLGPCLLLSFMVLSLCMPSLHPCSLCSLLLEPYPLAWTLMLSGVPVLLTSRALPPHPSLPSWAPPLLRSHPRPPHLFAGHTSLLCGPIRHLPHCACVLGFPAPQTWNVQVQDERVRGNSAPYVFNSEKTHHAMKAERSHSSGAQPGE